MSGKSQWLPSKGDARVIKAVAPLHPVLTPRPHTAWSATPTLPHK